MNGDDFKWEDSTEVVIRSVDAISVYTNFAGDVVIRQQSRIGEEDSFIVLPLNRVEELVLALQRESSTE